MNLKSEWESMNAKGAMDAVGIGGEELGKVAEIVDEHALGATSRAVLIYIRGMLQRTGQKFADVVDNEDVVGEWKKGLPASSSVSRAIPLAAVMQEHLPADSPRTIIDLGAGGAHASQVFLAPEVLDMPFFKNFRVSWEAGNMPDISKVVAVDGRPYSWDDAAQVYYAPDGSKTDKIAVMEALDERGDHGGKFVRVEEDIRALSAEDLSGQVAEGEVAPVIFLNNILYAVSAEVRQQIEAAVNELAKKLGATILQMEGWQMFEDEKPEVVLPGSSKPLALPAYVRMGTNLSAMQVVAKLDGNTGKPFILVKKDGLEVFINKDGEEVEI